MKLIILFADGRAVYLLSDLIYQRIIYQDTATVLAGDNFLTLCDLQLHLRRDLIETVAGDYRYQVELVRQFFIGLGKKEQVVSLG